MSPTPGMPDATTDRCFDPIVCCGAGRSEPSLLSEPGNGPDPQDSPGAKTFDFYVLHSPADRHCAVARLGEGGTVGWPQLHGPDSYQGCWNWIRTHCSGGPNYFTC